MKKQFFFDIETIPCQLAGIKEEFARNVTAPAQYKKQDSIDAWLAENREAEAEAAWLKTSFDGGLGHVVCIGFAINDGPAQSFSVADYTSREEEAKNLGAFFAELLRVGGGAQLIGHNIIGFDIPFLWKRAMVLGVKPPMCFPRAPKPWSELVADTMLMWDSQQRAGGSMDRICRLMGIPGKGGMDGSKVWPAVAEDRIDDVAAYCRDDVDRTRAMYRRMTFEDLPAAPTTQAAGTAPADLPADIFD